MVMIMISAKNEMRFWTTREWDSFINQQKHIK